MRMLLAMLLSLSLLFSACFAEELAAPVYPESVPYPDLTADDGYAAFDTWREDQVSRRLPAGTMQELDPFFRKSAAAFLSGDPTQNQAYSPLNVYLALGMLARVTDGESRQQLMNLLGTDSIDRLSEISRDVWRSAWRDDGAAACELAASMWLRDGMAYHQETLDALAENWFAAAYSGTMGSAAYDAALQAWLNEHTGGLLTEQIGGIHMTPETVLALAATLHYSARWNSEFDPAKTEKRTFHSPNGDVEADFMSARRTSELYSADGFKAVNLSLNEGSMWFFLPDEGVAPLSLLEDEHVQSLLFAPNMLWEVPVCSIDLRIPKFDVTANQDLCAALTTLGITDVLDDKKADFSPLTDMEGVYLSSAPHGVRIKIDEEGVEAASYTVLMMAGMGLPPEEVIDFTLDRPFLFAVISDDGLPLILGVVNEP